MTLTGNGQTFQEFLASLTEKGLYDALRCSIITVHEYNNEQTRRSAEQQQRQREGHSPTASESRQAAERHMDEWKQRIGRA